MVWGEAAEKLQDLETARDLLERSRAFYQEAGAPNLERVNSALGRIEAQLNDSPPT
jgi:hypothetical protein